MLTGRRAFDGEDVSLTLAAVMKSDPDLAALPPGIPGSVRACLDRCLQKDPRQRLRDIGDVRLVLEGVFDTATPAPNAAAPTTEVHLWRRLVVPTSALVAGLVIGLSSRNLTPDLPRHVTRFEHALHNDLQFKGGNRPLIDMSPDGRSIVYTATDGLYLHSLDGGEDRRLVFGGFNLSSPVFLPEGDSVAYFDSGQLKRIALTGGAPIVIANVTQPYGLSWSPDETLLFGSAEGISRVPTGGGTPEVVIAAAAGEQLASPQLLPGSDTVLFTQYRMGSFDSGGLLADSTIAAQSLRGGARAAILAGGANARLVGAGHLVYTVGDELFGVGFDTTASRTIGRAASLNLRLRLVIGANGVGLASLSLSNDGALAYLAGVRSGIEPLAWVSRSGKVDPIAEIPPDRFTSPRLSGDGRRVVVIARGDARIYDLATGRETRVTTAQSVGSYVDWAPGDHAVTYTSTRKGRGGLTNVWTQSLERADPPQQITALGGQTHIDGWAPRGTALAVHHHDTTGFRIRILPADKGMDFDPVPLTSDAGTEEGGVFSPDGRFIAYVRGLGGQVEVVIRPYPGPLTPVSIGGGREPVWARNGELYYRRSSDDTMMVVRVKTTPALTVSPPTALFAGPGNPGGTSRAAYAVTADGQRFLMSAGHAVRQGDATAGTINVVLNWTRELTERVVRP